MGASPVESDIGIAVVLPLEMPIGAQLLNVDIGFFDGSTAEGYTATLYEYIPWALGLQAAYGAPQWGAPAPGAMPSSSSI